MPVKNATLVHVTNVADSFVFYRGQIAFLKDRGFEVHLVSSPSELLAEAGAREQIPVHAVPMLRKISPFADIWAICRLTRLFQKLKPTLVHASFPKGGLLGVLAARLAGVPVVVYGMRGLRFETSQGWRRQVLFAAEKISCSLADLVIANSFGNQRRAWSLGLVKKPEKIRVMGHGSSNGVDALGRFNPQKLRPGIREELRRQYHLDADDCVIGFVGRLVRDKGITELAAAWQLLRAASNRLHLILVGPIESHDPLPEQVLEGLQADERVIFIGPVSDPAPYYALMDILVLPSHREGFPNTPLEAAAMGLPVVATAIDGCNEAVVDGVTGLLVPVHDSAKLAAAIQLLRNDPVLRRKMGENGRRRVLEHFQPEMIWRDLYRTYMELIKSSTQPSPLRQVKEAL